MPYSPYRPDSRLILWRIHDVPVRRGIRWIRGAFLGALRRDCPYALEHYELVNRLLKRLEGVVLTAGILEEILGGCGS